MATKALTRCYRFQHVDFEPDLRLLVWRDQSETQLNIQESRLLETLCYFAGEVITQQSLYNRVFPFDTEQAPDNFSRVLTSLTSKLYHDGIQTIPIQVIPNYGFRVPLPKKTCRLVHTVKEQPKLESKPAPKRMTASEFVKNDLLHKVSVALIVAAGTAFLLLA